MKRKIEVTFAVTLALALAIIVSVKMTGNILKATEDSGVTFITQDTITSISEVQVEEAEPEKSVVVTTSLDGVENIELGMQVTLYANLYGYENAEYTVTWQYSGDGANWESIEGLNALTYTFTLDETNYMYVWRAVVTE